MLRDGLEAKATPYLWPNSPDPTIPIRTRTKSPTNPQITPYIAYYTRITICHGTSKHTTSSIYTSTSIVNKKVNYDNLLQHGPDPPRWLAHNITEFTNSKHAILLTENLKHPTASPFPHYHSLQSSLSITTLPTNGEPQPAASIAAVEAETLGVEEATTLA